MSPSAGKQAKRPDPSKILGGLKDFQRATVDYVFERMYGSEDSTTRFLVADEVGLGKTLVARGLIARAVDALWDDVRRIDVVYICSNSDIARQNVRRLNLLEEDEFALASRITLLPTQIQDLKKRKLNFISFTPGTSLDTHSAMGIARERALLYWMLKEEWSLGTRAGPKNVFQGGSGRESFRTQLRRFDRTNIDKTLMRAFHQRLVEHDRRERREKRPGLRERFDGLCQRFAHSRQDHRIPDQDRADRRELIADLRAVLAASCITALEPDVVILDEFQRFRELLDPDPSDDAGKLANELFTYSDAHRKVRVLLLSATPYKMYSTAQESDDEDHYRDFFRTLGFLFNDRVKTDQVEELLRRYKAAILKVDEDGHLKELRDLKGQIENELKLVIARTERLAVSENRDGMLKPVIGDGLSLETGDVRSFVQLERIAEAVSQPNLLEYWKSAPYALNLMDDYVQKRELRRALAEPAREQLLRQPVKRASSKALLPWTAIERYGVVDPANPRVRQLREALVDSGAWRALWIPPSLPYYEMSGPFAGPNPLSTKRLMFSSWTLVPKATAALLSYEAEREAFRSRYRRPMNTQRARESRARPLEFRRRGRSLASLPVLGLLYASPTLARDLDPLAISLELEGDVPPSLSTVLAAARRKARALLSELPAGARRTGATDEAWYWAAPMLIDLATAPESTRTWFADYDVVSQDAGSATGERHKAVTDHVAFARQLIGAADAGEIPLGRRPRDLDRVLALQAIAGPGTTALRALGRVTSTEHLVSPEMRTGANRIADGLRTLLNVPEVVATIRGIDDREPYWLRALEYAANGCLQAVLDEYCHVLVEAQGLVDRDPQKISDKVPAAIAQALALRPARLAVDEIGLSNGQVKLERKNMRARYVTRFGVDERTEDGDGTTRADSLRNAFNSPFWPFGLASTSIGQEGLDFHLYCHAVVHWNIPSNPVDLEQREGRVHRYKGHAVRKNIARRYGISALSDPTADPWEVLFEQARSDRNQEANDLVPYWIYPIEGGAKIERHVPALPMSRDLETYEQVRRSLAIYRMAFGQARQDDLVDFLLSRMPPEQAQAVAEELRIDLTP